MRTTKKFAYGKLNLTLDVLGLREDGYHDMQMLMQSVNLCDEVTVTIRDDDVWACVCDNGDIPAGDGNLALKAARAFYGAHSFAGGVEISIAKKIPMQAGMAGGSADAAAVLRGLNELCGNPFSVAELMRLGEQVGSDVPYCVLGGTALAEGRGEILTPLCPLPSCAFVLVKPEFSVSTPQLFRELDKSECVQRPDTPGALQAVNNGDLNGVCARLFNVFQPVLNQQFPVIDALCVRLKELGALGACLTGTGSVVYGIFESLASAEIAADVLRNENLLVFTATPV